MATVARTTNRRALLGAIGMAPVAVLVAAAPGEAVRPNGNTEHLAWDQAVRAYNEARAIADQYELNHYEPAAAEYDAACEAIPHETVSLHGYTATTADAAQIRYARASMNTLRYVELGDAAKTVRFNYALLQAHETREAKVQAVRERCKLDALNEECERLGVIAYEAYRALCAFPVSSNQILAEKFALLMKLDGSTDGWEAELRADIDRLAKREAN